MQASNNVTTPGRLHRWWNNGESLIQVDDYKQLAQRRLPKFLFDFLEGNAEDGFARRNNRQALEAIAFVPRRLTNVGSVTSAVNHWHQPATMPIVLAPTALSRMFHPQGELAVAKAAQSAGVPYVLSTMASVSLEDVYAVNPLTWFQLYVYRDKAITKGLVDRVVQQGGEVLCVTLDAFEGGNRLADRRNGLTLPFKPSLKHILDGLRHPRWSLRYSINGQVQLANMVEQSLAVDGSSLFEYVAKQMDPTLTWDDIGWLRDLFPGRIILKGLLHPRDISKAEAMGVDGVVLSNHGGRQLDHAISGLQALQLIPPEIKKSLAIYIDGGVGRGTDVLKALSLGAAGCFIGRPYLYGLAAKGEQGVTGVLNVFKTELERDLKLLGCSDVALLNADMVTVNGMQK